MAHAPIDLRSDTFTVPDEGMRRAMAAAEVGDDVWGEDPTVRRLEDEVARRLGKEAAVFLPSGTMANLCAVAAQTSPADEVLLDGEAHIAVHEVGGAAAVAGVQLRMVDPGPAAVLSAAQVEAAVRPESVHPPRLRLLVVENTHNRRGGVAIAAEAVREAADTAHRLGLLVHCDGARLFNASVALGVDAADLVASCDTVSLAFSKGLGAPVGSAVAGDSEAVQRVRVWRKRLGGGMRQSGILAAAALYGLEHNLSRLADDHAHAALIAAGLDGIRGVELLRPPVPTNIVLARTTVAADRVVERAAEAGVLAAALDRNLLRCMTYLQIDEAAARRAAAILREVLLSMPGTAAG